MEKMLVAKINATLNAGVAKAVIEEKILDASLPKKAPIAGIKIDRIFGVDELCTGYAYEQLKGLVLASRQLTISKSEGVGSAILDAINVIIQKEMNPVIDDAKFFRPIRLGTIARLNRLVSKRVKLVGDIGHYFGINTLNAGEVYAADKNGLYRLPISEIKYERMFK